MDIRIWPILAGLFTISIIRSFVLWFKFHINLIPVSILIIVVVSTLWWRDVTRERTIIGRHTKYVQVGLKIGMILFIVSEVMFFFAFFWTFFHNSLRPLIESGLIWPPFSIHPLNPIRVPLLNTAILLSSGVTITVSHHILIAGNWEERVTKLLATIVLGLYFTAIQLVEYMRTSFSIRDSIYGRVFFIATGFHGLHVIIGRIFLIVCLGRILFMHLSATHHIGYELRIWYWHFVDVVWLFLFTTIYWWGY